MTCTVMFNKDTIHYLEYVRKSDERQYLGKDIYTVFRHPEKQQFIFKWDNRLFLYDPTYSQNPEYIKNPHRETVLCMEVFDIFMDGLK